MKNGKLQYNEDLEFITELIVAVFKEEGYKTKRFSETETLSTTEYDTVIIKDNKGVEYGISIDKSLWLNRKTSKIENTNITEEN